MYLMSQVIQMAGSNKNAPTDVPLTHIEKAQISAQIAALIRASFKKLTDSDVRDVMQLASSQLLPAPVDGK